MDYMNDDIIDACTLLADRCGAKGIQIGFLHEDVPSEQAAWYAICEFQGARIIVEDYKSPAEACFAMSQRLLRGATCRCRQLVTLSDKEPGCRWRLIGNEWKPSCDAPPITVEGSRGDFRAIREALERPLPNRAERRKKGKK